MSCECDGWLAGSIGVVARSWICARCVPFYVLDPKAAYCCPGLNLLVATLMMVQREHNEGFFGTDDEAR